jgi:hypothetical protein
MYSSLLSVRAPPVCHGNEYTQDIFQQVFVGMAEYEGISFGFFD